MKACVFCARRQWSEDLQEVYLAGPHCFMQSPEAVAVLLDPETYHEAWDLIPKEELLASAVNMRLGDSSLQARASPQASSE